MKNVVAQLSLVVTNAPKHKHKPEFVEDAFKTIENAAAKMNHLLSQVDLEQLLTEVVAAHQSRTPHPVLRGHAQGLIMRVERDRLADVLGHIIQNAQEATPPDGSVEVVLENNDATAVIEVRDTGSGMDGDFIRNRLFRPFDSTKGRSGMGVGAYEAREFIRELGGQLDVQSEPGVGTCFHIRLPLAAVYDDG